MPAERATLPVRFGLSTRVSGGPLDSEVMLPSAERGDRSVIGADSSC